MTNPVRRVHVPVEPLSEARWSRVERGVFAAVRADAVRGEARAPSRGRARPIVACAIAIAFAAIAIVVGRGWMERGRADFARIATTDGASRFAFGESSLEVAPQTAILVHGDDEHGVGVVVDHGSVTCEVAPRHGRPPFVVDAGEVHVKVVGTRFTVARDAGAVRVHVDHGVVEVTAHGGVTTLHAGDSWPAERVEAPTTIAAQPTPAIAAPAVAPPPPPETSRPAPRAAPRHRVRTLHPGSPHPAALPETPAAADAPEAIAPPPAPREPTPEEQFESATRLERARPAEAEALYRRVAAGSSSWAANALFALGRLQADRGERAAARALLDQYLARYPHGTNAADARDLRDRLR